jgi:hypothetical protein
VVALAVAALLALMRKPGLPWLALAAGLLTTLALSTGVSFTPLSASRKVLLLVLLAPLAGLALDLSGLRHKALLPALAVLLGLASAWVFQSVLAQAEGSQGWLMGAGVGLFVALMVGLNLRLRDDGLAAGAATVGLGLAVAVSAVLSASIGTLMNGMAVAAAGGALLLRSSSAAAGGQLVRHPDHRSRGGLFAAAPSCWPTATAGALLLVPVVAGLPLSPAVPPAHRAAGPVQCRGWPHCCGLVRRATDLHFPTRSCPC